MHRTCTRSVARATLGAMRRLALVALLGLAACVPNATSAPPPARDAAVPAFGSTVATVDAARLGASWRPGCPVGPDQLRLVTLDHWAYDGRAQRGQLVVNADAVAAVTSAFRTLYDL